MLLCFSNIGNSNRSPAEKQRHVITDCGVCSYWGSRHTYVPRHDCTSKLKTATHTDIKLKPTVLRHSKILKPGGLSPPYVGKLSDNLKKPNATITTNAPELLPTMARCNMIQFENVITNTCVQTQLKERTAVDNKVYKNLISKRKDHSALENSLPNKSRKLYHDDKSETSRHQQTESRQSLHDSSQKENKVQDNRRKSRCDERSAIIISDDSPENTSFVPVTSNSQKNVSRENFVNKTYVGKSLTNDILTSKASGSNSVSVSTGAGNDREAEGELKIQTYVAIKQIQNSTTGVTDTNSVSNSITTADSSKSYVDQTTTPKRFSEDNMTHHSRGYKNSIPSVPASNITTSETYQLSVSTIPNTSLPSGATGISINLASSNANKLRSQTHSDVQLFVNKDQTNHPRITDVIFEFQTSSPNATQNTKSGTYTSTDISQSISDHKFDTTSRVTNQCMTEKDLRSDVSNTQSHLENAQATFEARIRNIGNNSNQMTTENMANDLNSMMPIAQPSPSHETMGAIAAPLDTINIPHTDTTVAPILRKPSHEIFTDASGIDHTEGVYFDIETTGFEIDCEIVQLSAIFKDKKFDNYIMPSIRMSRGASEITKIKVVDNVMYHDDKIVHSIPPQQAFQNFIYWLVEISATQRKLVLYAHNAKTFDVPRLLNHLDKFNLLGEFQRTVIGFVDTLPLFRALKPGLESYKQSSLAEKLLDNSTYDAHNALADVGILKALTSYINPTSEAIFKYSLKTEAAIKVARFSLQSVQRKHTLEKLVNANGISKDMVKKMADSGLNFNQLKAAHEIDRGNGISNVLSATDADGIVRVTKSKSVILKVQQYFDSLVKM